MILQNPSVSARSSMAENLDPPIGCSWIVQTGRSLKGYVRFRLLASSLVVENRRSARVGRNAPITWSPARA